MKPPAKLLRAVDRMQDSASRASGLRMLARIKIPPESARGTPWALVVRLQPMRDAGGIVYEQVGRILLAWEGDDVLTRAIGAHRAARMRVRWRDGRDEGEYTIAEIGPWLMVVGRAIQRVLHRDGRRASLAARYGQDGRESHSAVTAIEVWLGRGDVRRGKITGMPEARRGRRLAK